MVYFTRKKSFCDISYPKEAIRFSFQSQPNLGYPSISIDVGFPTSRFGTSACHLVDQAQIIEQVWRNLEELLQGIKAMKDDEKSPLISLKIAHDPPSTNDPQIKIHSAATLSTNQAIDDPQLSSLQRRSMDPPQPAS